MASPGPKTRNILDRIMDKVEITDACWLWRGTIVRGYGQVFRARDDDGRIRTVRVHREMYRMCVGNIAEGLEIDHLCNHPRCVNPDHLEPVTPQENVRRSILRTPTRPRKSCPKGHALVGVNLVISPTGRRRCRACRDDYNKHGRAIAKAIA